MSATRVVLERLVTTGAGARGHNGTVTAAAVLLNTPLDTII